MTTYFQQMKLSKSEWEYCEIPVSIKEKKILKIIKEGYYNLDVKYNDNQTLIQLLKIDYSMEIECYLYLKYFKKVIDDIVGDRVLIENIDFNFTKIKQPKKIDLIRLSNLDENIKNQRDYIFEFVLIDICKEMFERKKNKPMKKMNSIDKPTTKEKVKTNNVNKCKNIYTLVQLIHQQSNNQSNFLNNWVFKFVDIVIKTFTSNEIEHEQIIKDIFYNSTNFIEKNPYILKYENITLHEHQKQLFNLFKIQDKNADASSNSNLVFYTAPTGTGKTLSPIGLSNQYRIIYICASRHVGLAFAKNAISIEKKVAFAFGCETASDIRLHYFSAKDYEINKKTGGICKVDNSNGEKVEIMICDVHSYIIAMYYMLSFNEEKKCIMYWDEPTISLDNMDINCPLHNIIHELWKQNTISNIILSCATLPTQIELMDVIVDYRSKFENCVVHSINSYDCKKTISLIDKDKHVVVPHIFFENYQDILNCVEHCQTNKSILRYFDLNEIVKFVKYILEEHKLFDNSNIFIDSMTSSLSNLTEYFQNIEDITMANIKIYYLKLLSSICPDKWKNVHYRLKEKQEPYWKKEKGDNKFLKKIKSVDVQTNTMEKTHKGEITRFSSMSSIPSINQSSNHEGVLLTTADAHTLTDGVSIFFAEDVEKIGRFMIHQSKIPEKVLFNIKEKIEKNTRLHFQLDTLYKKTEDKIGKDGAKEHKMEKEIINTDIDKLLNSIEILKNEIECISLDSMYIPNTKHHQLIWCPENNIPNAFVPNISSQTVAEVMDLNVSIQMKLLLLMGIGVFSNEENTKYKEIVKKLCFEENLYLIIANSDFIYGLNYQLCHSFFGKDLVNMTQQKIIQAIGRIGRGNIQQEYTIRIRDNEIIEKLFLPQPRNIEAENMCRLFNSL